MNDQVATALARRLGAAADVLLDLQVPLIGDCEADAATLLASLIDRVRMTGHADKISLLCTATSTVFPSEDTIRSTLRYFETHLYDGASTMMWFLDMCLNSATTIGTPAPEMDIVNSGVVVDVKFSAQNEHNTGIQRVVRNSVLFWAQEQEITLVAWLLRDSAMRALSDEEADRVLDWADEGRRDRAHQTFPDRNVIPRCRQSGCAASRPFPLCPS